MDTAALTAEAIAGRPHAVLDVTDPEPLPAGFPLWNPPDVRLAEEPARPADTAIDGIARCVRGVPLAHAVRAEDLDRSA
ncbi:hypothetical protein ACIP98_07860 [Streptomyces sp. NPDC088354]|uniref:hypothetical protein n=1 Tax=unclassified Streptomyces TaxID=2593676 RepID=UPI0029BAFAF2|nr:hypothetical protein [Streptomyces sp. MI02-7b]MDX3071354.1 hypothetical protein [Streptomyces sp. MI02-7b]